MRIARRVQERSCALKSIVKSLEEKQRDGVSRIEFHMNTRQEQNRGDERDGMYACR